MSLFCICGVCIPVNVIWPIILLFLKPIWDFLFKSTAKLNDTSIASTDASQASSSSSSLDMMADDGKALYLTDDIDLKKELSLTERVVLIRFTAEWCKPCKKIETHYNTYASLSKYHKKVTFLSVDVDKFDMVAAEYKAFKIPLFVVVANSKEVDRYSGDDEKKLLEFIEKATSTGVSSCCC